MRLLLYIPKLYGSLSLMCHAGALHKYYKDLLPSFRRLDADKATSRHYTWRQTSEKKPVDWIVISTVDTA
jgi:hypothetical protein